MHYEFNLVSVREMVEKGGADERAERRLAQLYRALDEIDRRRRLVNHYGQIRQCKRPRVAKPSNATDHESAALGAGSQTAAHPQPAPNGGSGVG